VESDGLGLDLALLDVDLVAGEDNGDVFTNTDQVTYQILVKKNEWALRYVRCQLGTFLYVIRDVTSNMIIPHCPLM
jgi:hypothetical protein